MIRVVEIDMERIVENGHRFIESDSMLGEVLLSFFFIPLEFHIPLSHCIFQGSESSRYR